MAYVCRGEDLQDDKNLRTESRKRRKHCGQVKMPEKGSTKFNDLVKGQIEVSNEEERIL